MGSLQALFGHGAWIGHLSFLLLVLAILGNAARSLRLLVIVSAIAELGFALLVAHDPALAAWAALLLAVSAFKIVHVEWFEKRTRFSPGDEHLRSRLLSGLSRRHARALIDHGTWVSGKAGERLLTEGEPVTHLYFLHEGAAAVSLSGAPVGQCSPGDLIGDATATSGAPATASVDLTQRSELWCIWADELRRYVGLHPGVRAAIERQLNEALRDKLSSANRQLAEARTN